MEHTEYGAAYALFRAFRLGLTLIIVLSRLRVSDVRSMGRLEASMHDITSLVRQYGKKAMSLRVRSAMLHVNTLIAMLTRIIY